MEADEAISLINQLIDDTERLRQDHNTFDAWRRKCRTALDRIFGEDSKQSGDLAKVSFQFNGMRQMGDNRPLLEAYDRGVEKSKKVLLTFIDTLFRRTIRYDDIISAEIGRTTILDGWGIHMSLRGGWVWNLWGRDCVVLQL